MGHRDVGWDGSGVGGNSKHRTAIALYPVGVLNLEMCPVLVKSCSGVPNPRKPFRLAVEGIHYSVARPLPHTSLFRLRTQDWFVNVGCRV